MVKVFFSFLLLSFSVGAFAGHGRVTIGAFDSSMTEADFLDPRLGIDAKFLEGNSLRSKDGQELSIGALNKDNLSLIDRVTSHADMSQWQLFVALSDSLWLTDKNGVTANQWMTKYEQKHFLGNILYADRAIMAENQRSHAALVARVFTYSLSNFRMLPIPLSQIEPLFKDHDTLWDLKAQEREVVDLGNRAAALIKSEGIKVFNLSAGWTESAEYSDLTAILGTPASSERRRRMHELALSRAKLMEQMIQKLVVENPQTLFVFAAGNSGARIEEAKAHSARIKGPNVIVVGAVDKNGVRWKFSDYSEEFVELYAWGERVAIPGKTIMRDGTSFAAPWVARQAALLLEQNSELTAIDLKKMILDSHSHQNGEGLRVLNIDPQIVNDLTETYRLHCATFLTEPLPPL